jgi:hypothetical protein
MINRDPAESQFGLTGGFSEAQLSSCIGTLPYSRRAKFLRLDNLPAETSRKELERLLNGNYKRTISRTIRGRDRGTAIVFFIRRQEAREASIRVGSTFTSRGATVTCTWLGGRPREGTTRDKELDTETIEDIENSGEETTPSSYRR